MLSKRPAFYYSLTMTGYNAMKLVSTREPIIVQDSSYIVWGVYNGLTHSLLVVQSFQNAALVIAF